MIDRFVYPIVARVLRAPARRLAAAGVAADAVTLAGFTVGLGAALAIAHQAYLFGLALLLLNRLLDGLDGAVAREVGATDRGAFLDIALDFFFYALVPAAFAVADPATNALAAAVLILSFVGTGSSFLAFASIAARRGETATAFPQKGIYYLGGLAEGTETIAAFVAMCLWPQHFAPIAWAFACLCLVTMTMRWWWGWRSFSETKA